MIELSFEDFKKIAKGLKSAYPTKDFLPDEDALKVWYHMLKDLTYEQASAASYKYIATGKFPPTIADIRNAAAQIITPESGNTWADGWAQLMAAIRKFGYYRQDEAFENMDDITCMVARRLGWYELCMSENLIADRANFRMAYEQEQAKKMGQAALPNGLRAQIDNMQNGYAALKGE